MDSCCRLRASTDENKHRGCLCRCFPKEWMSTVPAGHVSLVFAQCIWREICFFNWCNLPLQNKPTDFFLLFYDKHRSLRSSLDHFSNILTQAACCVVYKSPIFFLRKINTAHYLAEKRSLCQAATHSTGRQPPSRLSHFSWAGQQADSLCLKLSLLN